MQKRWQEAKRWEGGTELAQKLNISPMLVRLIRNRGAVEEAEIQTYLRGSLKDLHSPWLLKGMKEAVEFIQEKERTNEKIRIIGDYDIDGVNATQILLIGLKRIGLEVDTVIPDRLLDGYGINKHLIENACEEGIRTIVTCDNGIAAIEEIAFAKEKGMDILITDHHEVPYEEKEGEMIYHLPVADVILNPKQVDCEYPFKKLCGAAVAYKFIEALYETYKIPKDELEELLVFTAIATVGDVMDLVGENRIIVKYGLNLLEHTENLGLRALLRVTELEGKKLNAYHIGFVIGPCMNASGRLDTAKRALQLLGAKTVAEADEGAGDLKALNDRRKELTKEGTDKAYEQIETELSKEDSVLVVYLPECHESLAGIIAGRVRERYYKPCFVLTKGEEGVKGSGRSIEGYHMFREMTKVKDLFTKYGGHPMAAGLSMEEKNIEVLRRSLNENCTLTKEDLIPVETFDGILPFQYVSKEFIEELKQLEPFGKGNERPVFAEGNVKVKSGRVFGKNRNVLKVKMENKVGTILEGIAFGEVEEMLYEMEDRKTISLLYYPEINEYMGNESVQLNIRDYK